MLYVVDATNPATPAVTSVPVPAAVSGMAVMGGQLYTTSSAGLNLYRISTLAGIPVTVQVQVPTGGGVALVPGSFSLAPTHIVTGTNSTTLEWDPDPGWGPAARRSPGRRA